MSLQCPLICRAAVCQEGSPGAASPLSSTARSLPSRREPEPLPACLAKLGLNDARGRGVAGAAAAPGQKRGCGEVLRPCVAVSPAQDPCPSLQSPCGSVARPPQWEGGSVFPAALAVRALRFGRALPDDRSSNKVRSAVIRLGGRPRSDLDVWFPLSPLPSPLERCSVSPGSVALREQLPFVLPCTPLARRAADPRGVRRGPGCRQHSADLAPPARSGGSLGDTTAG